MVHKSKNNHTDMSEQLELDLESLSDYSNSDAESKASSQSLLHKMKEYQKIEIEYNQLNNKSIKQSKAIKRLVLILCLSLITNIVFGINGINPADSQQLYNDGYTVGYNDGYDDGQSNRANIQSASDQWTDNDYESSSDYEENTVYVTDTGSKYHQYGCQYLRESCHEVSLADAQSEGYDACSICW